LQALTVDKSASRYSLTFSMREPPVVPAGQYQYNRMWVSKAKPERTADRMGDSGEGLVDASSRLQERMEEIQDSRRATKQGESHLDPESIRALESLRLAKVDLERQLSMTVHEVRRQHLLKALAEIDRRLSDRQNRKD
jgi:hypothetical protein